jgi:EAL domain-containing protein (putative c-di-GMP-specific phosphodiesterase class I)
VVEFVDYVRDELKKYPLDFDILPTFGVYVITNRLLPVSSMLDKANLAAKEIKGNYLSGYAYYTEEMGRRLLIEQELINDMNEALETGQFIVYIQPKYRLDSEEPSGAEALVRWKHPEKGLISPGIFIPVFERNGFIVKLDFYVWELVCKELSQWIHEGYDPMPVSVNVSRVNLYSADLVDTLCALTEKYGVPNGMLNLEITESVYTKNPDIMREMIKKLRSRGFVVMMDDFGSGYSSLNMLKDIEVDVLKIDVKFLSDTRNELRSRSIISSIISMAKRISLMTVAEGVEKKEQAEFLSLVGCDFAQGYYYSKPMPCDEYEKNIIYYRQKSDYNIMENAGTL